LSKPFASAGLIGSKTKWARFQKRLLALGHQQADIHRISCPIGRPTYGKHPQTIAISVTFSLLQEIIKNNTTSGRTKIVGYANAP
jgi:xanthine dehydrogenase accessory factor